MQQQAFDTDAYEDQLAFLLLDLLRRKDVLPLKTYKVIKANISKEVDDNDTRITNSTN